jgi:stage III sporulation protein SpoIIIAA
MIDKLLTPQIADIIKNKSSVSELRIRAGRNVVYYTTEGRGTVCKYIATRKDIEDILLNASGGSLYTVNDMLNKGFIMYEGGVRIGLTGEGVTEKGELIGIKNVCYLTVRIPREIELNTEKLLLPAIQGIIPIQDIMCSL